MLLAPLGAVAELESVRHLRHLLSMSLSEELQKLADLYDDGVLTEQEFAEAKRQLLHPAPKAPEKPTPDPTLGRAAETYVNYQIVMGIIGFIIFLIFFFGFWLPGFSRIH